MTNYYCRKWFRAKKQPIEVWDEKQARVAHENGKPYTVLVESVDKPAATIVMTDDYAGVGFLDTRLREYMVYQFQLVTSGKLFLSMAIHREFFGETDEVKLGTSYIFKEDGSVIIREEHFNPKSMTRNTSTADVSSHYESFPTFGDYESLLIKDRP